MKLKKLKKHLNENQLSLLREKILEMKFHFNLNDETINKCVVKFKKMESETAGNFECKDNHIIYVRINLNKKYLTSFGFSNVLKTFSHELAHFVEYIETGKVSHDENFKIICAILGGHMNEVLAGEQFKSYATNEYLKKKSLFSKLF